MTFAMMILQDRRVFEFTETLSSLVVTNGAYKWTFLDGAKSPVTNAPESVTILMQMALTKYTKEMNQ